MLNDEEQKVTDFSGAYDCEPSYKTWEWGIFFSFLFCSLSSMKKKKKKKKKVVWLPIVCVIERSRLWSSQGINGFKKGGFYVSGWVGGWMDLFWEKNGRRWSSSKPWKLLSHNNQHKLTGSSEGEREDGYFPNISEVVLGLRNTDPLCLHMLLPAHRDINDTSMSVSLSPTPWSSSSSRNFVFL